MQKHYQCLGSCSVDMRFDDAWKREVEEKVTDYCKSSPGVKDGVMSREIDGVK